MIMKGYEQWNNETRTYIDNSTAAVLYLRIYNFYSTKENFVLSHC